MDIPLNHAAISLQVWERRTALAYGQFGFESLDELIFPVPAGSCLVTLFHTRLKFWDVNLSVIHKLGEKVSKTE